MHGPMRILPTLLFTFLVHCGHAQVVNGGFENGLNGWNTPCACAPVQTSADIPPGGGSTSLSIGIVDLNCICTVTDAVHQATPWLYPGQWVLSAWIKSAEAGNVPGASVRITEGPAFTSPLVADAWSFAGDWTFVADTFLVTSTTNFAALELSLIPDDGNQMAAGLLAYFDQVMLEPILGTAINGPATGPVAIFPNPATQKLWIDLPETPSSLQLFDAQGRSVPVHQMVFSAHTLELNVEALLPGPYVLRIANSSELSTLRFVEQ